MSEPPALSGAAALLGEIEAKQAAERAALPSIEELCIRTPLYSPLEVKNKEYLRALRQLQIQFDAHCIECAKSSTFKTSRSYGGGAGTARDPDWMLKPGYTNISMSCQRNSSHEYLFCFTYDGKNLTKYGQNPSLEDITGADVRKYEPLLRDGYFGELKRATGLASHGIGIGSFVYLRRIFERLIHDHHTELKARGEEVEGFGGLRMDKKIGALRSVLPEALVKNKAAYSILSVGIHELDEETCKRYFPVVRAAIIQILEQDFQIRQSEHAAAALEAEIARISGDLKVK